MLSDLAALTPPLLVSVAFLVGLFLFLRRQMAAPRRSADEDGEADVEADPISATERSRSTATDSEAGPAGDPHHSSGR